MCAQHEWRIDIYMGGKKKRTKLREHKHKYGEYRDLYLDFNRQQQ